MRNIKNDLEDIHLVTKLNYTGVGNLEGESSKVGLFGPIKISIIKLMFPAQSPQTQY
jgi:hypothetical protein